MNATKSNGSSVESPSMGMKTATRFWTIPVLGVPVLAASCAGRTLDGGSTAEVRDIREGGAATGTGEAGGQTTSGNDGAATGSGEAGAPPSYTPIDPVLCSNAISGTRVAAESADDCTTLVAGRWEYCGATVDPTIDDPAQYDFPFFLPQPAGVEFALEDRALRFYTLVRNESGALVRARMLDQQGTVDDPFTDVGSCAFHMSPDSSPGRESGWNLQRFREPDGLFLLTVNLSATYVRAPQ